MYPIQHNLSVILAKLCKEISSYDNGINLLNFRYISVYPWELQLQNRQLMIQWYQCNGYLSGHLNGGFLFGPVHVPILYSPSQTCKNI